MNFDELKALLSDMDLTKLTNLSKSIGEIVNIAPRPDMPYVGDSAFTHKAGLHISAMMKNDRTYEHIDPSLVGNSRKILELPTSEGSMCS